MKKSTSSQIFANWGWSVLVSVVGIFIFGAHARADELPDLKDVTRSWVFRQLEDQASPISQRIALFEVALDESNGGRAGDFDLNDFSLTTLNSEQTVRQNCHPESDDTNGFWKCSNTTVETYLSVFHYFHSMSGGYRAEGIVFTFQVTRVFTWRYRGDEFRDFIDHHYEDSFEVVALPELPEYLRP